MQISSRFTIAIHVLIAVDFFRDQYKTTSELLASSVHTNPVVIRRILQQLKAAGLIEVTRGSGGARLAKPAGEITLLDVWRAVDCVESGDLFHFHEAPNPQCPVGRNIHAVLDDKLVAMQQALQNEMQATTLAEMLARTRDLVAQEQSAEDAPEM